ncbi:hypothetical protein [Halorussus salinus]|uniref:hypothetical protein n=1 Tax=Halorussus salinus TaxID=1364935 RepID=UPI001091BDDB|nr:hypothetical protein [Halorussus salinus]
MRRRALLALAGSSLAGAAGCLSGSSGDPTTDETTTDAANRTPDGTTETIGTATETTTETAAAASVSVDFDALQPGLVSMNTPDSIAVHPADGRYLLLDVSVESGPVPLRDEFSLRFAGRDHAPLSNDATDRVWRFYGSELRYRSETGEGLLVFELPESAADDSTAVLTWPGGEWRPDAGVRRRLAAPEPSFSVSVEIPETIQVSESPTIRATVENQSDVPGRFVAGLNRSGPMVAYTPIERVSLLVPAGETRAWELTDDSIATDGIQRYVGDDDSDMTYHFVRADERVSRDVRYVQAASTTDTA